MDLKSDYMLDDELRCLLNELTRKTFGFDFEGWVKGGYFKGDYIPYSLLKDGKIISNVSANRMCFMENGVEKNYIQLGTVMTDEEYRGQGLAEKLIKYVVSEFENICDGIYLFGNLKAVGFYRKMGFAEGVQYRYSVKPEFFPKNKTGDIFLPVNASDNDMKAKYMDAVLFSAVNSSFDQINRYGLQMFYTADRSNLFYSKDMDCFIVMNSEENSIIIRSIICKEKVALADVLQRMEGNYDKCRLGFVPHREDMGMCVCEQYNGGEDYRFFYIGAQLESVQKQKLYFPELSHA
ncbi:MAG: GNAT family N-acetyltransferase [Clostridiaceae bacterium]|nr:GNAT family N-acetyltransferase [Clostridiaceae bacterium]